MLKLPQLAAAVPCVLLSAGCACFSPSLQFRISMRCSAAEQWIYSWSRLIVLCWQSLSCHDIPALQVHQSLANSFLTLQGATPITFANSLQVPVVPPSTDDYMLRDVIDLQLLAHTQCLDPHLQLHPDLSVPDRCFVVHSFGGSPYVSQRLSSITATCLYLNRPAGNQHARATVLILCPSISPC